MTKVLKKYTIEGHSVEKKGSVKDIDLFTRKVLENVTIMYFCKEDEVLAKIQIESCSHADSKITIGDIYFENKGTEE